MHKKLAVVVGTRPEAIKMAPLVMAIEQSGWARCDLVLTGQHQDLVAPILAHFGLKAHCDLECMTHNQSLAGVSARILERFDAYLEREQPDAVLAQGDTVSVLGAGLASFFRRIPLGHVEAGLRTGTWDNPFPEEMNRVLTSRLATWHFAPTTTALAHLLREGVDPRRTWVTGNTVIDALKWTLAQDRPASGESAPDPRPYVLVTAHRRENFGRPMQQIFSAMLQLAGHHPELDWLIPLHPNPHVQSAAQVLRGRPNIRLLAPSPYPDFCRLLAGARLVLSDSGGVQEEAPALGKPVLVLRDETERPEAVTLGANRLVGTRTETIVAEVERLLSDDEAYAQMARAGSPYGDGKAAQRIVHLLAERLADRATTEMPA